MLVVYQVLRRRRRAPDLVVEPKVVSHLLCRAIAHRYSEVYSESLCNFRNSESGKTSLPPIS